MKTQYNFKIEDELKQELDSLQSESDVNSKEDFLNTLLSGYKQAKAMQIDTEIDLSKYDTVSKQTKTVIYDAFKHILATIESNSTNNKQQALLLEKDSLLIVEERKDFEVQLEQLKSKFNQELVNLNEEHKQQLSLKDDEVSKIKSDMQKTEDSKSLLDIQVKDLKQELAQVKTIAEQVQTVSDINKDLRNEITLHNQELVSLDEEHKQQLSLKEEEFQKKEDQVKELEKTSFQSELIFKNQTKEIELLKEEILKLSEKDNQIKELEKQNTILETKLSFYAVKKAENQKEI